MKKLITAGLIFISQFGYSQIREINSKKETHIHDTVYPIHQVTLKEAHIGSLSIDTLLLNSYGTSTQEINRFYLKARNEFLTNKSNFTNTKILEAANKHNLALLGGPMLGKVKEDGVSIWLRPVNTTPITLKVRPVQSNNEKTFTFKPDAAGKAQALAINGLASDTDYVYEVLSDKIKIAAGSFRTSPRADENKQVRIAFGSCFHKIGLHNPNLIQSIRNRNPNAMMLLGDIAVDDRENNFNMHRSDYLLRDLSQSWQNLSANVPLYTSWDDHDYLNNDLSGVPYGFSEEDVDELRSVWLENWNNPPNDGEGIYFNARIGQVELIMLDTRSCRKVEQRGQHGSYLGDEQLIWLKNVLAKSTASFKVISSGTMWSDYVTNGKDSWGTWDTLVREEIFTLIETENISGVLLISGDRHGARGFTIPRPSGFKLYEFEAASLGGVPGPPAMAEDISNQIFGYRGDEIKAFGEFTFYPEGKIPSVVFRLIDEFGNIREEHILPYDELTP